MKTKDFFSIQKNNKTYGIIKRRDISCKPIKHSYNLYIIKNSEKMTDLNTVYLGSFETEESLNQAIKDWNL